MNQQLLNKDAILNGHNNRWLTITSPENAQAMTQDLALLCQHNQQQKRWILCVDSDDLDIQPLAEKIDCSKLLRVNGQHQPLAFEKIATTLLRGNCSTVIIWDQTFSESQLQMLQSCAKHGNTECIIVNSAKSVLH
ncbi:hypothetical protein [Thalassotalea sp. Y01]|uniref:hypothetical protein n=1 Tax=Thalassotalea sp. Y01 TaxID=2729613 RepID=UPI00145F6B4C|nr:hypothetical protein [Thalassotalea sp. Y01]NMP16643.1 hypothetical protein [Thalassotalea sp. Y01]